MPIGAAMLPPPQAAIAAGTSGEAAPPNTQTDHETVTEPVHQPASPHDHGSPSPRPTPTTPAAQLNEPVSKPPRPIPTSPSAQVNQQGPSSDPHVESSSKDNDDDPLGGSFFASPSRSTAAPPEGTTSGGAADPHTLTALYTLVSEQGKKIESLESELQAHKQLVNLHGGRKIPNKERSFRQMEEDRSFSDDQLKDEFDKIRHALANLQSQHLRRSLKRQGADLEQPDSKKRKSLATRKMPSSEVDLNAPDTSFIKVLSDDDSDDSDDDTNPLFWHAFAAWEVIPTGLGDVNALYFTDKSSKYFTHLREIPALIDRPRICLNTPYPLSASLMKKMLKHKLEVEIDGIGNDMTYAVQLIQFIKNQLASCVPSA
ncbi:hypothetical protein Tco_1569531 [Tanacetum coccineum]